MDEHWSSISQSPFSSLTPPDPEDRDPRQIFRCAMCDALAIALHRRTKLPLGLFRAYFPDEFGQEGEEAYLDFHAVVIVEPTGPRWVDVDGVQEGIPVDRMRSPLGDPLPPGARFVLEPASRNDVASAFTVEGLSIQDIERADRFLLADPLLSELLKGLAPTS